MLGRKLTIELEIDIMNVANNKKKKIMYLMLQ
jgi:hypothetical protein